MRMEQLQYLAGIQETGSIVKTAEQYFISPQAVSKAIKSLEKEWGIVLLERSAKSVALTEAGLLACQFAKNVLREYELFSHSVSAYRMEQETGEQKELIINTIPRFVTPALFDLQKRLKKKNPKLEVNICNRSVRQILSRECLRPNEVGLLAFCETMPQELDGSQKAGNLQWRILKTLEYQICVHHSMPLAKKESIAQKDLDRYAYTAFCNDYYTEDLQTARYKIDSFEQQRIVLQQDDNYTRCTKKEYEMFFKKGFVLIPQRDALPIFFVAVYHPEREAFVDEFLDAFEEQL